MPDGNAQLASVSLPLEGSFGDRTSISGANTFGSGGTSGRVARELILAGFGMQVGTVDAWVIDRLTSLLVDRVFHTGQVLWERGSSPEHVFFMRGGQVRFDRASGDTWTYLGNWLVGSYEAIIDAPYNSTATAIADFSALSIRASEWSALMEDSMQLVRRALMRTTKAIAALEDRFVDAFPTRPNVAWWAPPAGEWGVVERLALLADVRMLRGAGVQVLADLAAVSRAVSYAPGEIVLRRHVPRHDLIILAEGVVEATRVDPDRVHPYVAGDLVCGAAAFGDPALHWEVRAKTAVRGVACAIDTWFDLMEEHYELARSTFAALADRREALLDQLAKATGNVTLT